MIYSVDNTWRCYIDYMYSGMKEGRKYSVLVWIMSACVFSPWKGV